MDGERDNEGYEERSKNGHGTEKLREKRKRETTRAVEKVRSDLVSTRFKKPRQYSCTSRDHLKSHPNESGKFVLVYA